MSEPTNAAGRPRLLAGTIKAVGTIGVVSLLAAGWLSNGALERGALSQVAGRGVQEPTATGSIERAARGAKLDPCTGRAIP